METGKSSGPLDTSDMGPTIPLPSDLGNPGLTERYTRGKLHAQGGLGQVWLARDNDLGREVALKQIRPDRTFRSETCSRFLEEARITGQLEHPGIVPIYELGHRGPGMQPFYTMRFIRGRTLSDAIVAYHHKRANRQAGPLDLRELLGTFVSVCQAVAYAHSRGVIHRDLKGQNVVWGDFGEVIVLDWGLAKLMGGSSLASSADPTAPSTSPPVSLENTGSRAETMPGQVMGTPSYMAPEQAEGRLEDIDPRTDVYSLGAILYEILTGAPPFQGPDSLSVLQRVIHEPPRPPRQLAPEVSPALEGICLKTLAKQAGDRYPSAGALAGDIKRWLADEPVSAYRERWTVRAGRWVRRHRTAVTAGVAAVTVAAVCLGVATGLLARANRETQQQRDKARDRYRLARQSVDHFQTQISESQELKAHGLESLRTRLLEGAVGFYEELIREEPDTVEARAEQGRAYQRLGALSASIGHHEQAEKSYHQALAILQPLADAHPDEPPYAHDLSVCMVNLGSLYRITGRLHQAEDIWKRAQELRQKLADAYPDNPDYGHDLGVSHNNLATMYQETGRKNQAEEMFRQAVAIHRRLFQDHPDDLQHGLHLVLSTNNLGILYKEIGKPQQAIECYQATTALCRELLPNHPDVPEIRYHLASAGYDLGIVYASLGQFSQAKSIYETALEGCRELVKAHPLVLEYQNLLALIGLNLGGVGFGLGKLDLAETTWNEARDLFQKLTEAFPRVPKYRHNLALTQFDLGALYDTTGHFDRAEAILQKALANETKVVEEHPTFLEYSIQLGGLYNNLGDVARHTGKLPKALEWYSLGIERIEQVLQKEPREATARTYLPILCASRADVLDSMGRFAEALKDLDRAIAIEPGPNRPKWRAGRALSVARAGDHVRAAGEATEAGKDPGNTGETFYNLACAWAQAAGAAQRDNTLVSSERGLLAEKYSKRALDMLEKAGKAAYFNSAAVVEGMKKDTDLEAIKTREDFKKLVEAWSKKHPPK